MIINQKIKAPKKFVGVSTAEVQAVADCSLIAEDFLQVRPYVCVLVCIYVSYLLSSTCKFRIQTCLEYVLDGRVSTRSCIFILKEVPFVFVWELLFGIIRGKKQCSMRDILKTSCCFRLFKCLPFCLSVSLPLCVPIYNSVSFYVKNFK